jgi:dTDP-4-amino-4,6-dideoxygalactose transaminase
MPGCQIPHFGLARQYNNLKDELLDATHRALKDGQLVGGSYTRAFESWLKYKTKTSYAMTVHSGTQALEIIARYKKIKHNETMVGNPKVRIPNLTYPATLNAFLNAGWDVELVDTDSYGIAKFELFGGLYDCMVGLYGRSPWGHHQLPARYDSVHGIIVDGAQHWLESNGHVGSGMAISFDPTKNLNSSGNGDAIVTNDEKMYLYAMSYTDNNKPYFHDIGTNSKMSEQDCAQLMVRTKYIDEWQQRREKIANYWSDSFKNLPIKCLDDNTASHTHQKFAIYMSDRNPLRNHLMTNGIQTKISYDYVLGDLPIAKDLVKPDMLSTSVMLSRGVLSLPIYPELTDIEVEYIANTVKSFYP